jgi:hypothetical protein
MDIREELKSAGVYPSGPVSAWPESRNNDLLAAAGRGETTRATKVKASTAKMAKGLLKTAGQAMLHGKVSQEIRDERMATCKACPFYIPDQSRCSECGCFMEAKSWVGGNPDTLCPKQKWER